jgi:hypothetical protein
MRRRVPGAGAGAALATALLLLAPPARGDVAPDPSAADRGACEALTAQGRRSEAVTACSRAVQTVRSGTNVRALVHALVGGPTPPTTTDLAIALSITARERESGGGVTAAAATCDIAERMGDMVMLQRCTEELRTTAPEDPATAHAAALLEAQCPPWRFWGGWTLLGLAFGGTLAHAMRRAARRGRTVRVALAVTTAIAAVTTVVPATAHADVPPAPQHGWLSKWPIDDERSAFHVRSCSQ